MKAISEMTLEELQDYALQQKNANDTLTAEKADMQNKLNEANELNKTLQKRNNSLFMLVEQQGKEEKEEKEEKPVTCEEFARNYVLGGNKQ